MVYHQAPKSLISLLFLYRLRLVYTFSLFLIVPLFSQFTCPDVNDKFPALAYGTELSNSLFKMYYICFGRLVD